MNHKKSTVSAPAISILVPIYNVERYLTQCLESIRLQTFSNFEVICINDGSTDGSLAIIESFAEKDNRFRIFNKSNTGYGHSMNMGLSQCQGEYVGIVESDDFIEPEMFATLYQMAKENNLDVARCNYYKYSQEGKIQEDLHYIPANQVICPRENVSIFYQAPAIWANLYRRSFLQAKNIRFLETPGASYQDTSFIFKVYALCEKFQFINKPLLNYRIDSSNSSVNNKQKVFCVCTEYKEILDFSLKYDHVYEILKSHIPVLRFACYAWNLSRISQEFRYSFLKQWRKEIIDDFNNQRINKEVIGKNRYKKMLAIRYFPIIYVWRKRIL